MNESVDVAIGILEAAEKVGVNPVYVADIHSRSKKSPLWCAYLVCARDNVFINQDDEVKYANLWYRAAIGNAEEDGVPQDAWDENERGPKQALVKKPKRTIWKYQIPVLEVFNVDLPKGANIIRFANEGGKLYLWADVCPDEEIEPITLHAFKTGAEIPTDKDLTYLGCAAIYIQQELMLYYYQEIKISGGHQ